MNTKTQRKGRPPKYEKWLKPEGLKQIEQWASKGLTDEELAGKMKIAIATFYNWKADFIEFSEAVQQGKENYDKEEPVSKLRKLMQGYERRKEVIDYDAEGNIKNRRVIIEEVGPSMDAVKWWLINRNSEEWRDKKELDSQVNVKHKNPFSELSVEELRKIAGLDDEEKDWEYEFVED